MRRKEERKNYFNIFLSQIFFLQIFFGFKKPRCPKKNFGQNKFSQICLSQVVCQKIVLSTIFFYFFFIIVIHLL